MKQLKRIFSFGKNASPSDDASPQTSIVIDENTDIKQAIASGTVSAAALRAWLHAHPGSLDSTQDGAYLALANAARNNRCEIAELLIDEFGVDVNSDPACNGWTALAYAVLENHAQMARVLLGRSANADLPCQGHPYNGKSPAERFPKRLPASSEDAWGEEGLGPDEPKIHKRSLL